MKELIFRYGLLMCLIVPMITVFQVDVCNALPDVEDPSSDIEWSTITQVNDMPIIYDDMRVFVQRKKYYASSNLVYGHCKTDAGTELKHWYFENDYGANVSAGNDFWDWMFPEATRLSNCTNKTNCIAYAMDGFSGDANYDYWVNPADCHAAIDDDCTYRDPDDQVEDLDRLIYLANDDIAHIGIVTNAEDGEPTCLEWQDCASGTYQLDVSYATNRFSTPGCRETDNDPLQGEYDLDYYDGDDSLGIYPNP